MRQDEIAQTHEDYWERNYNKGINNSGKKNQIQHQLKMLDSMPSVKPSI